jgi:multidrug efflux system outer membrane protein
MRKTAAFASLPAFALFVSASCTVGPNYSRPQVPTAPTYRGSDNTEVSSAKENSFGDQKWADVFREPELQNLIRTAIEKNYDVRIAAERILEQAAQVRITRSQQFPTFNIGGTGIGAELPSSLSSSIGSPLVVGSFNLSAAWNPDFWGLYRRQTEAARAQLLAQEWAQRAVRLTRAAGCSDLSGVAGARSPTRYRPANGEHSAGFS